MGSFHVAWFLCFAFTSASFVCGLLGGTYGAPPLIRWIQNSCCFGASCAPIHVLAIRKTTSVTLRTRALMFPPVLWCGLRVYHLQKQWPGPKFMTRPLRALFVFRSSFFV